MKYIDAGTTYSKIISTKPIGGLELVLEPNLRGLHYYIVKSKNLKNLDLNFDKSCGHQGKASSASHENEIIALAQGCKKRVDEDATVLDLGSRDAKWICFKENKFHDMDWNTSCASSTGATVEMLLKFYDIAPSELGFTTEKFPVTCGVFGLEKIMDDISNGANPNEAVSKFVHGIAYNAWNFCKKPKKIYLSGGFCENECFVQSLQTYCEIELLGRFMLVEGLLDGE